MNMENRNSRKIQLKIDERITYLWNELTGSTENMAAALFITAMAVYYLWRMLFLTPWYDELYTYYYFVSRGPIYAAIHWPLPNNHVGYSVLSAVLDLTGLHYFGLRGISFFAAIANLILVYRICKYGLPSWYSFFTMVVYGGLQLVNLLSVQGRGYTLSTTCFLVSILTMCRICKIDKTPKSQYVILVIAMVWGLYTVPSSVYWVLPVAFGGVIFLLGNGIRVHDRKKNRKENPYLLTLYHLVIAGIVAIVITLFLYSIIWLAIGSNLFLGEVQEYSSMGHVRLILRHPVACLIRGITYMLATPYIQSVEREGYLTRLWEWLVTLGEQFVPGFGVLVIFVVVLGTVILIRGSILHFEESKTAFRLMLAATSIFMPVLLILQRKLPYYRVFTYFGMIVAICSALCLRELVFLLLRIPKLDERGRRVLSYVQIPCCLLFMLAMVLGKGFFAQLGDRENNCYQALTMARPEARKNICVLDVDQQYLLKFGWGIDCENTDPEGADLVLIDRKMMEPSTEDNPEAWKYLGSYETIPWDYLDTMHQTYENQYFVLYTK